MKNNLNLENTKEEFRDIAKENLEIYNSGIYGSVNIKDSINNAINKSEYISSIDESEVNTITNSNSFKVLENILNINTIDASLKYADKNVLTLNFASATTPGGRFLLGSKAQEESICRASALYPCLLKFQQIYEENNKLSNPLYHDYLIYSPNVPIFRNGQNVFLDNPQYVSFITCPAVNKGLAVKSYDDTYIDKVMKQRIDFIIKYSAIRHPDVLILGAFGCGAFKNNRDTIFSYFEESINKYIDLNSTKVVFAVI